MSAAQAAAGSAGVVKVLGTGGTIAGVSHTGRDRDYQAASLSVEALVAAVPALAHVPLACEQVCQVDSKDMGWPQWRLLLRACLAALDDPTVAGVVVTHGTDTLEETALLLQVLLPPTKPVVLTAAMRPATSAEADGPANLALAVQCVQAWAGHARGVAVAVQGRLWPALAVRKAHSWAIDAFDGGGLPPLALTPSTTAPDQAQPDRHGGVWSAVWPPSWGGLSGGGAQALALLRSEALPWVPCIVSHADAQAATVRALAAHVPAPQGWLLACTGHGTVHAELLAALQTLPQPVWRAARVARGGVAPAAQAPFASVGWLTPAQGRLLLSLALALSGSDASALEDWRQQLLAEPGLAAGLMPDA